MSDKCATVECYVENEMGRENVEKRGRKCGKWRGSGAKGTLCLHCERHKRGKRKWTTGIEEA